ncbi:MAG TPA: hypothetical protein VGK58_05350 [Lacipirellulaceae bacterium]
MAAVAIADCASPGADDVIGGESGDSNQATHIIEDVLIGAAIAAFALDERVPRDTLFQVIQGLLKARQQGREDELIRAAKAEAIRLPDWDCEVCRESSPGTFELCWNCGNLSTNKVTCLSSDAEVLLTIDAATILKSQRNGRDSLRP